MNIIDALNQLENGKKIRRKGWKNIVLISYKNYEFMYDLYIYDLVLEEEVTPYILYKFSVVDILSDDWEVIK